MNTVTLSERIRAKCQQQGWYGPALFGPPWDDSAVDDPRRTGFAYSPATEEQLRATEERLGMALPSDLVSLYSEVANGGFGPGCGLRGAEGGYRWYEQTIVETYQSYQSMHIVDLAGQWTRWPLPLLPLCDLGCDQDACLDCQSGQVIIVAPTKHGREIVPQMRVVAPSLESWLDAWIQDTPVIPTR